MYNLILNMTIFPQHSSIDDYQLLIVSIGVVFGKGQNKIDLYPTPDI